MLLSSNDPARHVNGVPTFNRISWCDSHNWRFADKVMLLNQLVVGDANAGSSQCQAYQKRSRSRHVCSCAIQVMAEDITESAVDACIETGASCIKSQEADTAGARCPGERRRYSVQPGNELGHQQEEKSIPGKDPFCSAIVEVGISRESMNEVQHLVAAPTTRLVPDPVSQYTGGDNETHRGEDAQLAGRHERPGRQQKWRFRYGEPYLVRKCRSEEDGIAMP